MALRGDTTHGDGAPVYRLVQPAAEPPRRPRLDPTQQAVVDHPGGPLLVLAGPGTGKTTTIVEAVAARIDRGVDPEQILVLTFSRRAAAELRDRVTARVARTIREPLARTFHSYAYGVLRRAALLRGEAPPRLLTAAEQDAVVAELLRGDLAGEGAVRWPDQLMPALATAGFRGELRDLLLRATERGVDPELLAAWGRETGTDAWLHAAAFLEQYEAVTAFSTAGGGDASGYDPAELVRAAIAELEDDPELLRAERGRARWLFVDEYQDTDPAQVELLQLLAGGGGDLVVVGDPDQAIYAFRGAEPRGIVDFPDAFRTVRGEPAPRVSLGVCRRSGPALLAVSRRVAEALPGPWEHRRLAAVDGAEEGAAEVHVFGSASVEAAYVADTLRRAHLVDDVPWGEMAVVVRNALAIGPLRRALTSAGVPVEVGTDDLPLAAQPAVAPLLAALRALLPRRDAEPGTLDLDEPGAEALLTSPLGGATVLDLRRLRRAVRIAQAQRGVDADERGEPLAAALADEALLEELPEAVARPARKVAGVLAAGRVALARDGSAEDVLWAMWQRSGLAGRWARASAAGGAAGAGADRDLDAVVALFDAAAGFVDRLPSATVGAFVEHLAAQELPGVAGAGRESAADAVRLLTAHASKGLEWDVVCVAGVQEGIWPDLRDRGTLLGTELLVERVAGIDGAAVDRRVQMLAEERRLFYVACTRARRRLVVTAVEGALDGPDAGATASRFLDLVAAPPDEGRPLTPLPRSLTLPALVADLRRTVSDPQTEPARRSAAAAVLRRLADEGVPGASPADWWGLAPLSDDAPLVPEGEPVRVRPSAIETFQRCPLKWVLGAVGAEASPDSTRTVGSAVHAVAQQVAEGLPAAEAPAALAVELDALDLGPGWADQRQRVAARDMLDRFLRWHAGNRRELLAAEADFDVTVGRARIRGQVDRLERDSAGRLVVVDLKTGRSQAKGIDTHGQLAAYQVAVAAGAFGEHGDAPGGAALLQVGSGAKAKEQAQDALPADVPVGETWAGELVAEVGDGMGAGTFEVRTGSHCSRCPARRSCPMHERGRQVTA
ncbi:ATP-dependent helicase [Geodermatophilus sp. FMUSA9-8]|uniref:ATP-dependent helicase n=1 Tax=Geodermatophilus sp. FMUSA9-8 TaxID=3120155 RepID=UPI00300A6448